MIEPNCYTDETIHVANWLLGTGEAAHLLELARADVEDAVDERCLALDVEEFAERLRERLAERIDEQLIDTLHECFPRHCEFTINELGGVRISPTSRFGGPGYYADASAEDLLLPLVGQAMARLDLDDVAEIILEHVAAPQPA